MDNREFLATLKTGPVTKNPARVVWVGICKPIDFPDASGDPLDQYCADQRDRGRQILGAGMVAGHRSHAVVAMDFETDQSAEAHFHEMTRQINQDSDAFTEEYGPVQTLAWVGAGQTIDLTRFLAEEASEISNLKRRVYELEQEL